jgi:hypothetical protein
VDLVLIYLVTGLDESVVLVQDAFWVPAAFFDIPEDSAAETHVVVTDHEHFEGHHVPNTLVVQPEYSCKIKLGNYFIES